MTAPLIVCNAITAEITKDKDGFDYEFGSLWDGEHLHALNFVKEIETKFKNRTKTYGFLKIESSKTSIPSILGDFISNVDEQFLESADALMTRLKASLNEEGRRNTTVGHMVFIHYQHEDNSDDLGMLLVVLLDKKDVFDFNDSLTPTQFKSIDVDKLRQAVTYDLTLFKEVYPSYISQRRDEAYLKFISGRSKGQFFQEALGAKEMIDNTVSVHSIFEAVEKYGESLDLHPRHIKSLQDHVESLMLSKKGKQISLSSVARRVNSNLPESHSDQSTDDFIDFVNKNEYQISEVFDVTKGQLEKVTNIEGRHGTECYYRIKKTALGSISEKNKSIKYDSSNRVIHIEVRDETQHRELMDALKEQESCNA